MFPVSFCEVSLMLIGKQTKTSEAKRTTDKYLLWKQVWKSSRLYEWKWKHFYL